MNPDEAWPQRPAAANVERLCIDDVYNWEQTRSQKLIDVDHPTLGRITPPGPPLRLDDEGYSGGRDRHAAPPTLGQHTASILAWLAKDEPREQVAEDESAPPTSSRA